MDNKKLYWWAGGVAAVLVLIVGGWAIFGSSSEDMALNNEPMTPTEESAIAETLIEAGIGEDFSIILDANATTGYTWEPSFDAAYFKMGEKIYEPTEAASEGDVQLMGVGGKEIFPFTALKAGENKIIFVYRRPWESPDSFVDGRVFNIVAK